MPAPFRKLSVDEFRELVRRFPWSRKVNAVHMHHTWRPRHADWRGEPTIAGMASYHMKKNGWSDIAQHVTIAPDGSIWTGRNWNQAPASASGHNGTSAAGPFMFEMVGDFDKGRDPFTDPQREAVLQVITAVQRQFKLPAEALHFHNEMTDQKSCPGTAISKADIVADVRARHTSGSRGVNDADGPFGDAASVASAAVEEALSSLLGRGDGSGARGAAQDDPTAEPRHEEMSPDEVEEMLGGGGGGSRGARGPFSTELSPAQLHALRLHVINLNEGRLSTTGTFTSSTGEVDAIFGPEGLGDALKRLPDGEKLKVVFYAHGGLVSEDCALWMAHAHVQWFKKNGVYPIHFVWETGIFETLGQLFRGMKPPAPATRGIGDTIAETITDSLVEKALRKVSAHRIWTGMKTSADFASREGGGARYAADRLREFLEGLGEEDRERVELHAIGHSAGSIFHAHFLPTVIGTPGAPTGHTFKTVHFLAPAITVREFKQHLAPRVGDGKGIDHLSIFTMGKVYEKADSVAFYRKSLLYLIYYALEPQPDVPILGLEESLRADPELRALFYPLNGAARDAEIVWSVTADTAPPTHRSRSTRHGDFDNDADTMESVLRRILAPTVPASPSRLVVAKGEECGPLQAGGSFFSRSFTDEGGGGGGGGGGWNAGTGGGSRGGGARPGGGARRALCVGIDEYRDSPLSGCVADAELWSRTLQGEGFQTRVLRNGEATYGNIVAALGDLVRQSAPGDVVVFQFAGHGTQVPDVTGDEADGDTPGQDEALCPADMDSGALVIDDDVAEVVRGMPDGVNLTMFIDCCHSGTISRFGLGDPVTGGSRRRARFIVATPKLKEAHARFRAERGAPGGRSRGPEDMREVVFSACQSRELAYEENGQGEFTARATRILSRGATLTHEQFQAEVERAFGSSPKQHPVLDCAPSARRRQLLQPLGGSPAPHRDAPSTDGGAELESLDTGALVRLVNAAAQILASRG